MNKNIGVLGAGSWGSALALQLARNGHSVSLWTRSPDHAKSIAKARENTKYLPGFSFPNNLSCSSNFDACIHNADEILISVPSHAFNETVDEIIGNIPTQCGIAWATKGLDPNSGYFLSDILKEKLTKNKNHALISGPSFAMEVAKQLPTAVVVASKTQAYAEHWGELLRGPRFRTYTSNDLIGVQVGGAVKNVLAVAAGISDGLGFGANSRAALLTRGLHEMMQLGTTLGGDPKTFLGLTGAGDVMLTCTDNQSRNRRFGLLIADGCNFSDAEKKIGQAIEAIRTADEVHRIANKVGVEMPICDAVYQILYERKDARELVQGLLERESKPEFNHSES